ncbi:MAG: FAD:protein FMN transferase [Thermoanaerobaculia bacterium]|nr:FAD:protein FMN transferase [Thermoanaerobaculia bacterium]
MALPFADPQFWLVTGGALVALLLVARKLRRRARSEAEVACDRCPKPGNPLGPRRLGAVVALTLGVAGALAAETVERQVAAMGTTLRVEVEVVGDRAAALALAEAMIDEVAATEARLSTWRDDSELARINRAPVGEWVETSAYGALVAAGQCREATGGAFHPAVGRLVAAWGLRGRGKVPTPAEIAAARRGLDGLGYEDSNHPNRIRRIADVVLEEGAFGKGAGLDAALGALERLSSNGTGFVRLDLGGQVAWANAARPIVVDLADPRDRSRPVLELTLSGERGSLAVSGNSEKRFTFEGESFGHLLDPRTGRPAIDFGAVAIVDRRALEADCLSTALFVMGPTEGARWLAQRRPFYDAVYLVVDGERLHAKLTPGLAARARPLVADLVIEESRSPS